MREARFDAAREEGLPAPDETIASALESIAHRQPAAPAIHVPGQATLTYGALGAQVRYVRVTLEGWGIRPGDIVGAALPSRAEMAVAIATMPSSCTLAPLDPSLPLDAYITLLTRMKAKAVLVNRGEESAIRAAARCLGIVEIDLVPEPGAGLFSLSLGSAGLAQRGVRSCDSNHAYILTSSGTTGRRKLVPADHRVVLRYARSIYDWLDFTPSDVGVHITPVYLGNGLRSGLMNALLGGRSVALLPVADIEAFFASIEAYQPTFLTANFSLFRGILRRAHEFPAAVAAARFRFMRWAGRVDLDDADRLEQLFGAPMLTGLSSTETSRIAHDPLPPRLRKRGSVGLPLVNEVALLDSAGKIVSNGGAGEILVRGAMVFRGYLDDPELNAASFIGDWFRTGDLGHIDEGGYIYFVGRLKEIIDRGGEKISPLEIDQAIESLPGIKEAAAFGIPHPSLGEEMVAAVVREDDASISEAQVVAHVRVRAGANKVPRRVYFVERLPRTENGKLRRNALAPLLGLENLPAADGIAPPSAAARALSPLEGALAGLWSSLLQVPRVESDDDFFLLGGDSLRGLQLIGHLKALFGVDLPIQALFSEAATVAGMARAIEAIRSGTRAAAQPLGNSTTSASDTEIRPRPDRAAAPLSHAQLRVWFLARLDPDSRAYNVTEAHRLLGSIDETALRESLLAIVRRHEILRTTFALVIDEPRQIVHEVERLDFKSIDIAADPPELQEGRVLALIEAERQQAFDFANGPMVRFRLIRLSDSAHVLLRAWHHILWDGWSIGVFDHELSELYAASVAGRKPQLPALPLQYADYALWQHGAEQTAKVRTQLGYWTRQLARLAPLALPVDRPRPPVISYRGARLISNLPATLTAAINALARREGVTLFMTLLAAFQALLARQTGQHDIAVGTPIAGRMRPKLEGLVGFFANTLVLRADVRSDLRFRELLGQVRKTALGAYAHQEVPFERIVEEVAPVRDTNRHPLFQVLFSLQNNPGDPLTLDGLAVSRLPIENHSAKFDLAMTVRVPVAGLQMRWDYATDLFDAATIERMAGHYQVLLEAIVADPELRIDELPLLTPAERHHLLVQWNDTCADYPRKSCVHQLFEAQAARTPDAMALICGEQQLSYAELNARSNRLAHRLIGLGAGPDVLVAICAERSLELVIGLLGILKAGAAYVPLDPGYPAARLAYMLQDTQAPLLLTQQALLTQLPHYAGRILFLDQDDPADGASPATALPVTDPPCRATADSLAYVIYTSGSTGLPKGIEVVHRALTNCLWSVRTTPGCSQADRVLSVATVSFDIAALEIYLPLIVGARLVVVERDVAADARRLSDCIERHRPTLMQATPAIWQMLKAHGWHNTRGMVVLAGGEALSRGLADKLLADTPALWNMYGPTETTILCTLGKVAATDRQVTIGRPIANTAIYVLDSALQPTPIGVAGELFIGGDGLARGYRNRPDLTAQRFVPDPFSALPGARMYRSGDRVRILADGQLEYLGRLDDQVKIRGFRIEPGEIEAVLCGHPSVHQAVVLARENSPGDTCLVACVVPVRAGWADVDALRAHVSQRLPDAMRPVAYVLLSALPLTANGKVDRAALARNVVASAVPFVRGLAPRSPTQSRLIDIWQALLGIDGVGISDNFFEIGGHSLLATQLSSRIQQAFGVELPLRRMFQSVTIADLAADVDQRRARADGIVPERLIAEVAGLSDAEVTRQLRRHQHVDETD